jgi:hypothetical protein
MERPLPVVPRQIHPTEMLGYTRLGQHAVKLEIASGRCPGPVQGFTYRPSQNPLLVTFRQQIRTSQAEERFGISMVISGDGEIACPHQPLHPEGVDYPPQLREQVAIGERLAREPRRMAPFDGNVWIFGVSQQLLNRRFELAGECRAIDSHSDMVDDELDFVE